MDQNQPGVASAPAAGVTAGAQPGVQPAQPTQPQAPAGGNPPGGGSQSGAAPGQPGQTPQQVQVPVTVVQALRDEVQAAKTRAEQLEQQVNLYRANAATWQQNMNQAQPQQPAQAQPAAANAFEGMRDDDVLTVADVKKIVERLPSSSPAPDQNDLRMTVMKLEVQQMDPQFETTIRTYLPEVLASDPTLTHVLKASPNPFRTALTLARTNPKFIAARTAAGQTPAGGGAPQAPQTPMDQLALILQNLEKPGNPGQFGGAPVGAGNAGRFASMSDAEFEAHVRSVKGGF